MDGGRNFGSQFHGSGGLSAGSYTFRPPEEDVKCWLAWRGRAWHPGRQSGPLPLHSEEALRG